MTNKLLRRFPKDYSSAFKLKVVDEIEKGDLTQKQSQTKYGIQGVSFPKFRAIQN